MKYLILLAILAVAYLLWRNARLQRRDAPPKGGGPAASPQDMVRCPVCSLHLPRGDAVAGSDGVMYCSQEHRLQDGR
jgi:uncharacterized protein